MLNRLQKSMNEKDKGFTLIELLVVIVIIGILAAIAIPLFLNQREKGVDAGLKSDLKQIATLQETYYVDQSEYAGTLALLEADGYDFNQSDEDTAFTVAVTADGFCVGATNEKGSTDEGWHYDSGEGGLDEGACA